MYIVEVTSNISIAYLSPPIWGVGESRKGKCDEKCKGMPDGY
nr:MAG TPA: hypothetical protein [Caudoviricetes sp.]